MRISLSVILGVCWFVFSCKTINKSEIVIEGHGFDKKIKKVYLTEAGKWKVLLDSADCKDGKFTLKYQSTVPFEPFLASLEYRDTEGKGNALFVRNEMQIREDGQNHSNSSFMLDYGKTNFSYFNHIGSKILVNIQGGKEEDLYLRYDHKDVVYIPKLKNFIRAKRLNEVIELIRDNRYSYYLLRSITNYREQYTKDELVEILSYFNEDVQKSRSAIKLKEHISNSLDKNEDTRPLSLISNLGVRKENINRAADLNMLIFWASWCGPCRLEIPDLKKINKAVTDKDFYMASISIDKSKLDWNNALLQEKMSWDQFITGENEKDKVEAEYAFSSIPLVIFTNRDGKELARFSGYHTDNIKKYMKLIEENLANKKVVQ